MVIFFNLCLILTIIFSKFLKPNAVKMLKKRKKKRRRNRGGEICGKKEKKKEGKEREMKRKK